MKTLASIKKTLSRAKASLRKEYGVSSLAVFGSYVRGEQKKSSDLDVLVRFQNPPGLFAFVELQHKLSRILGLKVDLVMDDGLRPSISRSISKNLVPI